MITVWPFEWQEAMTSHFSSYFKTILSRSVADREKKSLVVCAQYNTTHPIRALAPVRQGLAPKQAVGVRAGNRKALPHPTRSSTGALAAGVSAL